MKLKIKFWDTERKFFLESAISCVTAFRNYMDIPAETRFSDCPNQAEKMRYIPVLHTGIKDLWQGDIVDVDLFGYWGDSDLKDAKVRCVVKWDSEFGCWSVIPDIPHSDFDGMILSGIKDHLSRVGNVFETQELMTEAVS
ncbi:MAG: hypothetical protein JXR39_11470 [Marinilabiliaceae bacterium]|nr:hypothetical protein [Marinilabiliaceae bacterium]